MIRCPECNAPKGECWTQSGSMGGIETCYWKEKEKEALRAMTEYEELKDIVKDNCGSGYYINSFVNNFKKVPHEVFVETIWEDTHKAALEGKMTAEQIRDSIFKLAVEKLTRENGLNGKYGK